MAWLCFCLLSQLPRPSPKNTPRLNLHLLYNSSNIWASGLTRLLAPYTLTSIFYTQSPNIHHTESAPTLLNSPKILANCMTLLAPTPFPALPRPHPQIHTHTLSAPTVQLTNILANSWNLFPSTFPLLSNGLRRYCTPDHFCDCLCISLENYKTLVTIRYVSYR